MKEVAIEGEAWNKQVKIIDSRGHFFILQCGGSNYPSIHSITNMDFLLTGEGDCEAMRKMMELRCSDPRQYNMEEILNKMERIAWYPDDVLDGLDPFYFWIGTANVCKIATAVAERVHRNNN